MEKAQEIIAKIIGPQSRIFGSKGQYRWDHPDNLTVFNSNICIIDGKKASKVWYGDLDVTEEEPRLMEAAKKLKTKIYVLYEMDARFDNEASPKLDAAVYWTDGKKSGVAKNLEEYVHRQDGKLLLKKVEEKEKAVSNVKYDEANYPLNFKLPAISKFSVKKGNASPVHKFYDWVVAKIGDSVRIDTINIGSIWISEEFKESMRSECLKWLKAVDPYATEYRANSNLNWLWLDIGPNEFQTLPDWAKGNHVYVRNDYIRAKSES